MVLTVLHAHMHAKSHFDAGNSDLGSGAQESAPVTDVSDFQQRCSAAYDKDHLFKDESRTSQYTNRHGLWWASGDKCFGVYPKQGQTKILKDMRKELALT